MISLFRRLTGWIILWTAIAALFASPSFADRSQSLEALAKALSEWWSWGLIAPIALLLDDRLRSALYGIASRAAAHFAIAPFFAIAYLYVHAAMDALLHVVAWNAVDWLHLVHGAFHTGALLWDIAVYFLIVGLWEAYHYHQRYTDAQLRVERLEKSMSEARLRALRMQLDPHFLFNALNTISAEVGQDPKLARSMIENLGDLLRLSLEDGRRQETSLRDELDFLDRYLAIQRIRFGEKLRIDFDIDEEAAGAAVPSLVIQPLVENAIRHGISPRSRGGTVTVVARRAAGRLEIGIRDDGIGLPADWPQSKSGLGLSVTRERIEALHNGSAKMTVGRIASGGTEVTLSFPFRSLPATEP
jgi:two-component system, LytTR family, sensor kinase